MKTNYLALLITQTYVLIHYVQTNVNYLPLKYPQKQVQRSMGGSHADPNTFNTLLTEYNDLELNS